MKYTLTRHLRIAENFRAFRFYVYFLLAFCAYESRPSPAASPGGSPGVL